LGHRKLKKFAEVATFPNVFEPNGPVDPRISFPLKGNWKDYFKNDNPIVLELACGRGEYTVGLARRFPNKNFIGMDIKGARIWKGAKAALQEKLNNAAFVRTRIDFITAYFTKGEVSEIWITFPDPFPRKENRRLMSSFFIELYRNVVPKGTVVHLKTDNADLFAFAMEQANEHKYKLLISSDNVYEDAKKLGKERYELLTEIQTYYEKHFMAQGKQIHYMEFVI
jgi:tRNA (guanine-N7-)-methyltransferase